MTRLVLTVLIVLPAFAQNPVQIENSRPGTSSWALRDRAHEGQIEGYASATSVNVGETIQLYVSTIDLRYTIEVFRMGWYSGLGGRRMTGAIPREAVRQPEPTFEPRTGLIECHWTDPYALTIPSDWTSGFFLAKLTALPSGEQSYIIFVVRDDQRASDLLFQSSVTTSQAYNNWGGKSLYPFNSTAAKADRVSFNRPYSESTGPDEFLYAWEYPMVRFLEREGYDVTYQTSIDTHTRRETLFRHRAFLSVGHDEYWSREMRDNVEAARDAGISLGFFSANTCYWQIRFESDLRTIVAYKEDALFEDPILTDGNPSNDHLATTQWRRVPVNRPEEALIGVMYTISQVDDDIVVENTSHWVYDGTGLKNGDRLRGLAGYEVDRMHGGSPPGTIRLAHSPVMKTSGERDFTDMTIYRAQSGAMVFATGTIQWSWGLDDFGPSSRGSRVSAAAQRMTDNVLNAFIYGAPVPSLKRRSVRR